MTFSERSYSGKLFRPRPEIHNDENHRLLIVATPWGPRSSAKRAIKIIQDYFLSALEDKESTAPFARIACLSPLANNLRIAVKLANDAIYSSENKNEYLSGIELFVVAQNHSEVVWVQVGYPYVLLDRPQKSLIPFGSMQDLSVEFSTRAENLPPLPNKLLGVDAYSDFAVESFRPSQHDRFILISRSHVPNQFFKLSPGERQLDNLSHILSQDDPEMPFWLGLYDLKKT